MISYKSLHLLASVFLSLAWFGLPPAFADEKRGTDWERIGDEDGVEIFKKETSAGILDFKGQGSIDAPPEKVIAVILDTQRAKEWVVDLEESKVVRWVKEPFDYIEYNHIGTPFVIKDRDFLSHVQVKREIDGSASINYLAAPPTEFPLTAYVRGDLTGSRFHLKPIDDGKRTWLEGEVHADPKGSVPKWVVNLFQKDWPLDTVRALRKQAAKTDVVVRPEYQELFRKGGAAK